MSERLARKVRREEAKRDRAEKWLKELLAVARDPATRASDPKYWDGVAEMHEYLLGLIDAET